jgi:ACS family D-galactonate transporter-like MFS transporter
MTLLVVMVTCLNYLDRANLAVAAPVIQKELGVNAAMMGIIFSSFAWSYAFFIPFAGAILDKLGPRLVYTIGLFGWSIITVLIGFTNSVATLIGCRVGVGLFEAPAFPTNVRCITAWHPDKERALAAGMYNAAQYIALGFLIPVLAWILVRLGWQAIFYFTGGISLIVTCIWYKYYRDPKDSRIVSKEELSHIMDGGGLGTNAGADGKVKFSWYNVRQLLSYRQVWGMFIGQFGVGSINFFFLTWFPTYLVKAKGLSIIQSGYYGCIPFLGAILGTIVGGRFSDRLIANGYSNSIARKLPIICGLSFSCVILMANYTNSIALVILFMSLAFFGQGIASTVTHALLSDLAPRRLVGLVGGMLFFVANVGAILSPLVVGFMVNAVGNFNLALVYVASTGFIGVLSYLFVMGKVYRIVIPEDTI